MSNQPTPGVFIELAYNSNAFFSDSQKGDVCIRTANSNQKLLFGVNKDAPAMLGMDTSNVILKGNIAIGGSSNPSEVLDVRNGNAYFDSNIYVMNQLAIGSTQPTESLDVVNGNAKLNSNLYVINNASIGITESNPTETLDIGSNLKVRSNAYVMYRVAVGKSNPNEVVDIEGNTKIANNLYTLQNLSVGSSNPRENVDIVANAIIRSNAYVMRRMSIGSSNPTEILDVIGNEKITGRLFVTSNIGAGTSNPTERLDVYDNTKLRGDLYALNKIVIGQSASNPNETLDVRGNTKIGINLYVMSNVSFGSSNPSEKLDVLGNTKVQGNLYTTTRIGVGHSNPSERIDVSGNILASSNIYAMQNVGIGTVFPTERFEVTGNAKVLSNLYVVQKVGVGNSNPEEKVHISGGNTKIDQNLYIMSQIGVGKSNPSESVDIIGNLKLSGNIYSMNNLSVGLSNPSEQTETSSNLKVGSNLYVINRLGVATSNPSETADFIGNLKVSSNIYTSNAIVIGGKSNPTEKLDLVGNAKMSSNLYVLSNVAIAHSNPTEKLDILGNLKVSSNIYTSNAIVIGGASNPTENLDLVGNAKMSSNLYVLSNIAIAHSNPTEKLDIRGNLKVSSNIYTSNAIVIGGASNPSEKLDLVGNAKMSSNLYVLSNVAIAHSNPSEKLDILGNLKVSSNIYTSNAIVIGGRSNPTEKLDLVGNAKMSSNLYVLSNVAIAHSNPTEKLDILGNLKVSSNIYTSNAIVIGGASNPSEKLDLVGNAKMSSNLYVLSNIAIAHSNPSEKLDILGNLKVSSNIYTSNAIVIGGASNPSEKLDLVGNAKMSSNLYVLSNVAIAHSNPTEKLDILGNLKVSSNIYTSNAIVIGGASNPSEKLDLVGNAKMSSNLYVLSNIAIAHSNPSEKLDILGNLKVSSNIYTSNAIVIGGASNPSEKLDLVGNAKMSSNLYVLSNMAIAHSNPTEKLDILGNLKVSSNIYTSNAIVIGGRSNPTEKLDLVGNAKMSSNLYVLSNVAIAHSNPTEKLDILGNLKVSSNEYIMGSLGVNTSNMTEKLQVMSGKIYSDTQVIATSNDSATMPSFSFKENSNTGMFHASNDAIGFTTSGSEKMRIDTFGNIGIGKSNPSYKLDISGSVYALGYCNLLLDSYTSTSMSNAPTANALKFAADAAIYTSNILFLSGSNGAASLANLATSASNTAYWSSNNLVNKNGDTMVGTLVTPYIGVNTSSPSERAHVTGNLKVSSNIYVSNRIGVNTSNPSQAIHVVGNMRLEGNLDVNGIVNTINTDVQVTDQFTVSNNGTGPALKVYQMGAQPVADFYDDTTLALRIADGGNVGIGTNTPASKLQVAGVISTMQTGEARYHLYNIGGQAEWKFGQKSSTAHDLIFSKVVSGAETDYMTVNTLGNVGIGTSNPLHKLDINGVVRVANGILMNSNDDTYIGVNGGGYAPSLGLVKKAGSVTHFAFTSNVNNSTTANAMYFGMLSGSNLAGVSACNLTTYMTLNNAGNLGIGTITPAYELDVNGYSRIGQTYTFNETTPIGIYSGNRRYALLATVGANAGFSRIQGIAGGHDSASGGQGKCKFDITIDGRNTSIRGNVANLYGNNSAGIAVYKDNTSGDLTVYLTGRDYLRHNTLVYAADIGTTVSTTLSWSSDTAWTTPTGTTLYFDTVSHIPSNVVGTDFYLTTAATPVYGITTTTSGYIGIGTSNPGYLVDINGDIHVGNNGCLMSGTTSGFLRMVGVGNATYIQSGLANTNNSAAPLVFGSINNVTEWARFDNSGNLGLGTSSPAFKLDVQGGTVGITNTGGKKLQFVNDGTTNRHIVLYETANNEHQFLGLGINDFILRYQVDTVSASHVFYAGTSSSSSKELMRIEGTGNVGIGTNNPAYMLHVSSNIATSGTTVVVENPNTGTSGYANISIRNSGSTGNGGMRIGMLGTGWSSTGYYEQNGGFIDCDQSNGISVAATSNSGSIRFYAGGTTEVMRVNSNQNVGIGTTSPNYKLDVNGDVHTTGNLHLIPSSMISGSSVYIKFADPDSGTQPVYLKYYDNGNPAVTVEGGRLGVNMTNPAYTLDVSGSMNSSGNLTGPTITSLSNLGMFSSNVTISLSNYTYGTNTTNISWASNAGLFGSNTAVSASNTTISLSNYTYGTNRTNISWASNAGLFGSNTAVWSSNNLVNKTGADMSNYLQITSNESFVRIGSSASAGMYLSLGQGQNMWNAQSNWPAYGIGNSATGSVGVHGYYGLSLGTQGATNMTIAIGGNVGIGTTTPSYKLDVNGVVRVANGILMNQNDDTYIGISATNSAPSLGLIKRFARLPCFAFTSNYGNSTSANAMYFSMLSGSNLAAVGTCNLTTYMTLDASGSLGIGTITPAYKLDVQGTVGITNTGAKKLQFANDTSTNRHIVLWEAANNEHQFYGFGLNSSALRYQVDSSSANHVFYAGASTSSSTELMRIQGNGNVGIGTSSPSSALHVVGKAFITSNAGANTDAIIDIKHTNNTQGLGIGYNSINATGTNTDQDININPKGSGYVNINTTTGYLQVNKGSGTVIIGTSNIAGGGFMSLGNGVEMLNAASNWPTYGIGNSPAGKVNVQGYYELSLGADRNTLMTLSRNGAIGIGTTTPSASYKLDVSGVLNATTIYQNGTTLSTVITNALASYLPLSGGTLTNALTITESTGSVGSASAGTLTLKHTNSGGSSSIVFTSTANAGSDYAYIKYSDHDISTYFPAQTGTSEGSRLIIGVENDLATDGETIVIKGGYGIAYDSQRHYFATGNVGVGTSAPAHKLQVEGVTSTQGLQALQFISGRSNNYFTLNIVTVNSGTGYTNVNKTNDYSTFLTYVQSATSYILWNNTIYKVVDTTIENASVRAFNINNVIDNSALPSTGTSRVYAFQIGDISTPTQTLSVVSPMRVMGNSILNNAFIGDSGFGSTYATFKYSSLASTSYAVLQDSSGTTYLNCASGQVLRFRENNDDKMTLSNGRLGINNTNPSYPLDVTGDARIAGTNFRLTDGTTTVRAIATGGVGYLETETNHALSLRTNSTTRLLIQADGKVAINQASATYNLDVSGDIMARGTNSWLRTNGNTGWHNDTHGGGWYMTDTSWIRSFGSKGIYQDTGIMRTDGSLYVGDATTLSVVNGGNFAYRTNVLFANTTGNVGIGTSTPAYKFDVSGDARITGGLYFGPPTGDPTPVITTRTVPTGQGDASQKTELILFHGNDPANGSGVDTITLRAPGLRFQTYNDSAIGDINNNSGANDRMYIDPTGNVGIGTTSPGHKLSVSGDINFTGTLYQNGSVFTVGSGSKWTSSGSSIYVGGSSNVGIGTASPSYPLQVNGTIYSTSNMYVSNGQFATPSVGLLGGVGDRLILWGSGAALYPYSLGIGNSTMWYSVPSGAQHQWYINGVVGMTLSNNNLGIGTATPTAPLHVTAGSGTDPSGNGIYVYNPTSTTSSHAIVGVRTNNSTSGNPYFSWDIAQVTGWSMGISNADSDKLVIKSNWNFSGDGNVMTFLPGGNVGIGTSSPSYKLHVSGKMYTDAQCLGNQSDSASVPSFSWPNNSNTGIYLSSGSTTPSIGFTTAGGERMRIDVSGNVGIGTTSPSYKLDVNGTIKGTNYILPTNAWIPTTDGINRFYFGSSGRSYYRGEDGHEWRSSTDGYLMSITNGGNLGIGNTPGSYRLYVSGEIYATNDITAFSDISAKSNLEHIKNPLDKIQQINGYTYDFLTDEPSQTKITERYAGLVAQEVEQILPEVVHKSADGKLSIAYGNMAGLFVESIKELKKENNELKLENQTLKTKLTDIEDKLARLESIINTLHIS